MFAAYRFLEKGVLLLNLSLGEHGDEQTRTSEGNTTSDNTRTTTTTTTTTRKATTTRSESESEIQIETTPVQTVDNALNARFVSSEECFKATLAEATRAFFNESLDLEGRIMAARLRVVCKILECLQDIKVAISCSLLFLKELHNLPAIGEVFLKGVINSRSKQVSEHVKSVLSLNFAVSEFVAKFSNQLLDVKNWPRIQLPTRCETIHPLFLDADVVKAIFEKEEFQLPKNQITLDKLRWSCCCVNSKGLLLASARKHVNVLNRSGEMTTFCELRQAICNLRASPQDVESLAVNRYDNVFVIVSFGSDHSNVKTYILFAFDDGGNELHQNVLDFLANSDGIVKCVVNSHDDIVIDVEGKDDSYVCDSNGNLKSRSQKYTACLTDKKEIIKVTKRPNKTDEVLILTKEGMLKRKLEVDINDPVRQVIYNYATSKLEILVRKEPTLNTMPAYYVLSCCSEDDEVERLWFPVPSTMQRSFFCSNPAGHVALVYDHRNVQHTKVIFM